MKNGANFIIYLFCPFKIISQKNLLILGFTAILISGLFNFFSSTHFDGILDVHTGKQAHITVFLIGGFINLFVVSIIFFALIRFFILKKVKLSSVLIDQSFARWPLIFISFIALSEVYQNQVHLFSSKYVHMNNNVVISSNDYAIFGIFVFLFIVFIAWVVYLMYHAFSKSSGISGIKGIGTFILGLLFAEVLSKYLYYQIFS